MILRKSDLSKYALEIGCWDALCDLANAPKKIDKKATEEIEIEILRARVANQ